MPPVSGDTATRPAPAARAPKRKRGEGQWALGYREPLNKNEENKKNDDGLNVRQRIIDIYSKAGFDSIDPADLRGRFRWYGLYTQRRPGIDGGKTAILEPEELNDIAFAGVRHPETGELGYDLWVGGGLSTNPMIAKRLGAFVKPGQVPEVWAAVAAVFRDYGYRRLRHRARIKFLVADWGPARF